MSGLIPSWGPRAQGAGRRAAVAVAVLAISVAAALAATFVLLIGMAVGPCGGDGGSPFAAEASALCHCSSAPLAAAPPRAGHQA